jgi:WD40 repeat protein
LPPPDSEITRRELQAVLDEEVSRLPEKYRAALILCHLEGQTNEAAARVLRVPVGSMSWRLARALELLRQRLTRRGVAPAAAGLAALPPTALLASVPPALLASTANVAALVTAESSLSGTVPLRVAALVQGALHTLTATRLRLIALLVLALGVLGAGAGALSQRAARAQAPPSTGAVHPEPARDGNDRPAATDMHGDPLPPGAVARIGTVRLRHGGHVGCVAYAPEGLVLASGGGDHAVRLWEARTGKPLRQLLGHTDRIGSVVFSPDGKTLVSAGTNDHTIRFWDVATGRELRRLKTPESVTSVGFAPDGKTLVSGSWDKAIHLWDAVTGAHLRRFDGHSERVFTVVFAPDGKRLASCGWDDKTIRLWDVATGRELRRFGGEQHEVGTLAFSPDGRSLASGGKDGTIHLWDVASGKELLQFVGHPSFLSSLAFSNSGKVLASGSYDRTVRLWDVATGKQIRLFGNHHDLVYRIALSPCGRTLASAGQDNLVRLWDVATGRELHRTDGHEHTACLALSADGKTLVSGSLDRTLRLWDAATGRPRRRIDADEGVFCLSPSPDGKRLATLGTSGEASLWDVDSGKRLHKLKGPGAWMSAVAFSPDGKTLGGVRHDGLLRIWEAATGKEAPGGDKVTQDNLTLVVSDGRSPASPVFAPDGGLLATLGPGWGIQIRDAVSGKTLRQLPGQTSIRIPTSLAFSADGKTLAVGGLHTGKRQEIIQLWEVATGLELSQLPGHLKGQRLAFSPDGRLLASTGFLDDPLIRVVEVATGKEVRQFVGHYGQVSALTFGADGKTLISAGWDTTILFWDVAGLTGVAWRDPLSRTQLEGLWADLASADGPKVHRALCRLVEAPDQAPAFLGERLRPASAPSPQDLLELVRQLGSARFDVRAQASRALEKAGEAAEPALREALRGRPPLEVRRRVEQLLARLESRPERRQAYRALQVLERLATPAARRLLGTLASGAEVGLTREARGCMRRLARRGQVEP